MVKRMEPVKVKKIGTLFLVLLFFTPFPCCGSGNPPTGANGPVTYSGSFPTATGSNLSAQLHVAGVSRKVALSRPNTQTGLPLFIVFHGTSGKGVEMLAQANDTPPGGSAGAIIAAPDARSLPGGEWDHGSPDVYWDTTNQDANSNPDLMLVRAIIQEALARYAIDPRRVYVAGYSNGGFFTILAAMALRDQISGFATSASGLVRCDHTPDCQFKVTPLGGGSGTTTCEALQWQAQCSCNGTSKPAILPTSGRRVPGYLSHSDDDDMVSVYYSCALAAQMKSLGYPLHVRILHRAGGHIVGDFLVDAWNQFLNGQSL